MTGRPKYKQPLAPSAPTIIQSPVRDGQAHELKIKRPRERERENIEICTHHCQRPDKPCSGSDYRMKKCRKEYEREERL